MQEKNKIFLAIIIGAVIIGGCIYLGFKNDDHKSTTLVVSKLLTTISAQKSLPTIKTNSVTHNSNNSVACGASNMG